MRYLGGGIGHLEQFPTAHNDEDTTYDDNDEDFEMDELLTPGNEGGGSEGENEDDEDDGGNENNEGDTDNEDEEVGEDDDMENGDLDEEAGNVY